MSKKIRKSIDILPKKICEIPKDFIKKERKKTTLENENFQKEIYKKLNDGTVLNFIRSSNREDSIKTNFSDSSKEMKYDLCMINKFDEQLNTSLSFISEFDLEEDEKENNNTSFDSLDNEESVEQIEILSKNNKKISDDKDEEEYNSKLEKEWEDIKELLMNKNSN